MTNPRGSGERQIGSIVVVSERPLRLSPPGHGRRIESLTAYYENHGHTVTQVAVSEKGGSLPLRFLRSLLFSAHRVTDASPELIVVSGLGAPHMLLLARRLARRAKVSFDSCDSWTLQLQHRRTDRARTLPIRLGIALLHWRSRIETNSYISARDSNSDRFSSIPTVVIPQVVDASLTELKEVAYPLERIVVAADFESFHNRKNASLLLRTLSELAQERPNVRVDIFGKIPADVELPSGVTRRGWVPKLSDVYDGNTGVVITNTSGSGIPNKVLEAIAGRRPMVAHRSLGYLDYSGSRVYFYEDKRTFSNAVGRMILGEDS